MSKILSVTEDRVREAAKTCPDAGRVLKTLFPEAFAPETPQPGGIYRGYGGDLYLPFDREEIIRRLTDAVNMPGLWFHAKTGQIDVSGNLVSSSQAYPLVRGRFRFEEEK